MREFTKVSPNLWQSSRFTQLEKGDSRLLYLYLLTSPHQNSAGIYRLPIGYACNDLNWEPKRYKEALIDLASADLVKFDEARSVVMVLRWFRHNPPMNSSHLAGIESILDDIQSESLVQQARQELQESIEASQESKAKQAARKARQQGNLSAVTGGPSPQLLAKLNGIRN